MTAACLPYGCILFVYQHAPCCCLGNPNSNLCCHATCRVLYNVCTASQLSFWPALLLGLSCAEVDRVVQLVSTPVL